MLKCTPRDDTRTSHPVKVQLTLCSEAATLLAECLLSHQLHAFMSFPVTGSENRVKGEHISWEMGRIMRHERSTQNRYTRSMGATNMAWLSPEKTRGKGGVFKE